MSSWSIHPAKVEQILDQVETERQALAAVVRRLESQDRAGTAPGAAAVASFYDARALGVRWIERRLDDIRDGTVRAVRAYDAGDLEMAAEQQSAAARASGTRES